MPSSLKGRIDRLARAMPRPAGKFVIVWPERRAGEAPIERRGTSHVTLNVPDPGPDAGDFDPREHLTAEQRAEIGPDDRVVVVVAESPEGRADA